jgi:D-glutamate cyclase
MSKYSQEILKKIAQIETICGTDVGRNIQPLVQAAKGGILGAARSLAEHPSPHVAIITGFFLPHNNPPAAETDGIVGCAQLAAGLNKLGIPVRIVTGSPCLTAVKSAVFATGISTEIAFDVVSVDVISVSESPENPSEVTSLLKLWESMEQPVSHIISIERPGPGDDGIIRNMRGEDITAHTAPLHLLFNSSINLPISHPKIISVGIGDGGNEIGMGNIPKEIICESIRYGEKIACSTTCDYLIVCGVSNWGANGLLAALSLLRPEWKSEIMSVLNPESELKILDTIVSQGVAVDGITGLASLSVDNLPWEFHAGILYAVTQLLITWESGSSVLSGLKY